ncbi:MAG: hypothetical protein WDZ91_02305 [Paenibacillaceae bacterium]
MKKLEIKSVGVVSMGKTTVYIMLIPMAMLLLIGFFALLIGILISQSEVAILGGVYMVIPIFMLAFYGAISMLIGLIYNWLAGKFGGLEITLTEPKSAVTSISSVVPDSNVYSPEVTSVDDITTN